MQWGVGAQHGLQKKLSGPPRPAGLNAGGQGKPLTDASCSLLEERPQAHSTLLCSSDKYAVRFIPRENGIYLIDVKFNGTHIPGSPFKIRVGEPGHGGDPGLVSAYGAGLEGGVTGRSVGAASGV